MWSSVDDGNVKTAGTWRGGSQFPSGHPVGANLAPMVLSTAQLQLPLVDRVHVILPPLTFGDTWLPKVATIAPSPAASCGNCMCGTPKPAGIVSPIVSPTLSRMSDMPRVETSHCPLLVPNCTLPLVAQSSTSTLALLASLIARVTCERIT